MLQTIIRQAWRQIFRPISEKNRILVICATRLKEAEFWATAPMGSSLSQLKRKSSRIDWKITFENRLPLPTIYNKAANTAKRKDILVFVHDDVWLDQDKFITSLDSGLRQYEVVGVAGNTRLVDGASSWAFIPTTDGKGSWDYGHLSGAVWHGAPGRATLSEYGPFPALCQLMDGVFLAARASDLHRRNVWFDERFDFHFYDLDFCRAARVAGLRIGTWGIPLIHESPGNFGGTGWQNNYERYKKKWTS